MITPTRTRRRSARALVLAAGTVVATACSGASGPTVLDAADLAEITAVAATAADRWGTGYAVAAHPLPDGRIAVVTAAGVYLADDDPESEPTEIDLFIGPTQIQSSVVSPDGGTLVVHTDTPAALRWYDLASAAAIATVDLGIDLVVREMVIPEDSGTLVASTQTGVVSWDIASPTTPPTVLIDQPVGSLAVAGGSVIAPVVGSPEILTVVGQVAERRNILAEVDASLVDAKAAPDGSVVAVNVGVGPDQFERIDTVHFLDPNDFSQIGSIPFERSFRPDEWAITSDAIAIAGGGSLAVFDTVGTPLTEAAPFPDDPIRSVSATEAGFVTLHQTGAVVEWAAPDWTVVELGAAGVAPRFSDTEGRTVTVVDLDGAIAVWDVVDRTRRKEERFASGEVTAVAIDADGERIAVATDVGRAFVFDSALEGLGEVTVDGAGARIDTVEFHPVSGRLITGLAERLSDISFDDTVTLWDGDPFAPGATIGGESEDVAGCAFYYNRVGFTPDGATMSTVSHDFSIGLHDGETGDYIVTLAPFSTTILDTSFSVTGDSLIASADDASVRVWDMEDFEVLSEYRGPPGGLQTIELLPDDESMIVTDLSGRLLLMDFLTGEDVTVIAELGRRAGALAVSPDGGIVAAPLADGSIGLWSTTSGALLTTFDGHASNVTDIEFAPDASWIVTSGRDGTVHTWDLDITMT